MMHLEIGGRRYPITAGETTIGSDPASGIVIEGPEIRPRHALMQRAPDGTTVVRKADPEAEIRVNGVRLGGEPTPVLHGDKIQVGEHELLVADDRRSGRTQLFDATSLAATPMAPREPPARVPMENGRVVCLTDGREYAVGTLPLVFGRDASSDVVVPGDEVSRRHAEIRRAPDGYLLVDCSANGTMVNGERIAGVRRLARGDVIRIGSEDFRFHADVPGERSERPSPPPGAIERLNDTLVGVAFPRISGPSAPPPTPLASLLVRSGARKGDRISIRTPVVRIGREPSSDVVLDDPSVSASHALLQRRGAVWVLTDLGSTNGTTVDGEPVGEDYPLGPGATIRFGEVAVLFEPLDDVERSGAESRFVGRGEAPLEGTERPRPRRPPRRPAPEPRSGVSSWVVGTVIVAAIAIAYLLLS